MPDWERPPLLVNIGNTHVGVVELCSAAPHGALTQLPLREAQGLLAQRTDQPWLVCSVVPDALAALQALNPGLVVLSHKFAPEIDWSLVDMRTYGLDRVANVIGAEGSGPVAIIDIGTAVTIDVLDRENRLLGGCILPGRQLQRKALHDLTAQLPLAPLAPLARDDAACLGQNTVSAIQAGVDSVLAAGITGVITRLQEELGTLTVWMTGGDAQSLEVPGWQQRPELTYEGLARAYRSFLSRHHNTSKRADRDGACSPDPQVTAAR